MWLAFLRAESGGFLPDYRRGIGSMGLQQIPRHGSPSAVLAAVLRRTAHGGPAGGDHRRNGRILQQNVLLAYYSWCLNLPAFYRNHFFSTHTLALDQSIAA